MWHQTTKSWKKPKAECFTKCRSNFLFNFFLVRPTKYLLDIMRKTNKSGCFKKWNTCMNKDYVFWTAHPLPRKRIGLLCILHLQDEHWCRLYATRGSFIHTMGINGKKIKQNQKKLTPLYPNIFFWQLFTIWWNIFQKEKSQILKKERNFAIYLNIGYKRILINFPYVLKKF